MSTLDILLFLPELEAGVHTLLSPEELHFIFGTREPGLVSREEYSLVALRDTLTQAREVAKRAGAEMASWIQCVCMRPVIMSVINVSHKMLLIQRLPCRAC